ncbi:RNA helicase [Clostridium autoethanogenum]|uniref:RNA helicase n=1 Tax=Clostridium autoethanogenum TaxID=84023 RepID=A0A3M0SRY2_9CLOT|nr:AAA family ATPase [Clostridium autoethanogenum]RMD01090.1 RNA helicase [Clostridium autoethanogenum]
MTQHISIRVPWHDNGWNGSVCNEPSCNNSCLRLKNIYENRKDEVEDSLCGQCMENNEDKLPCVGEGASFMSPVELSKTTIHPYKKSNPQTHSHFLETDIIYPAYSFPARPYAWLMKENTEYYSKLYNIKYNPDDEPQLKFKTTWVQEASNQKAIFDCFYNDVIPDQSLCVAYAKQVPFVEDSRRVVVAMGHVKKIIPAVEHAHTDEKPLRSMTWETMICHSIREDHEDGFVIPYQKMMEYAKEHPDFDISTVTVFAPDDAFAEFSYATEHVGYDAVIEVILSCIKAFQIINSCLDEDYSNVLAWLNARLAEVWKDRGAFPGLGAMFCSIEMPLGILIAKEIKENCKGDIWKYIDRVIDSPDDFLSKSLAENITPMVQKTWKALKGERKTLFHLLSRFSLTIQQAYVLFNRSERIKENIDCTDTEIIENPYVIYEKTRLKIDELYMSVKKVDMAVFPVKSVQEKYPVHVPSALTSDNDERRIRALAISVLEDEALNGNTILPCELLVNKMQDLVIKPECKVTQDIFNAIYPFLKSEMIKREMADGTEYYKMKRFQEFDDIIEKRIGKRIKASKHEIQADWRKMIDDKFDHGIKKKISENEERARQEKAAILDELAKSRISVLIGDAGTGKTTVLSVLCDESNIKAGGVLLLAPTGKARVRLMESMGEAGKSFEAQTVAQFLARSKRFDWKSMRYKLSNYDYRDVPETVIIDESSMLTEEMFGALMQSLKSAKRIIFVGDPNQLPPIGSGRPFVDLVYILREKLPVGKFPKVCNCYGELTVLRRQKNEEERMDVELSRLYTSSDKAPDEDVFSEIEKGNGSDHIEFVKWNTREELEEKLLTAIAKEIGMKDVDDQDGFDRSLGGNVTEKGTYFNFGKAELADKWQILAPVRNMPQGVMNINRLIHNKYRNHFVELSKRGYNRKIPKMFGPENIVYGDKVINVVNVKKDAYPEENALNYVANGEIGIAAGMFGKKSAINFLHVEFSSQEGFSYSYDKSDFDDESGTSNLELAYALTVHKSQGSQFKTVILVLAEPCKIISKELLYTALTRQEDKIIILYNDDPYHLFKFSSEEYSDIAKRFTDLFADVYKNRDGTSYKPQIVKVGNNFYEEKLIHRTAKGELVRSKSEVIIANCLFHNGIEYQYEAELVLDGKVKRPDFTIQDEDTGETWYWEHCGMMRNPTYARRWEEKKKFYEKYGIKEGKNLIVTYDNENGGLDSYEIENLVHDTFDL